MANNDIKYINSQLTQLFDELGGNTKEFRSAVDLIVGDITKYETHKSSHRKDNSTGTLKLLSDTKSNNAKNSAKLRDVANTIKAEKKQNIHTEKLEELKQQRAEADELESMMHVLYDAIVNDEADENAEISDETKQDMLDLFYKAGKPSKEDIRETYDKYQKAKVPEKLKSTTVVDETKVPD